MTEASRSSFSDIVLRRAPVSWSSRSRLPNSASSFCCAALAGVAIPLILGRLGIDPALAGSVILTTVTDVVGFFAFLGLATVLLI